MIRLTNVLRFRAQEPIVEAVPSLEPKTLLHPKVKRRRLAWFILMILFIGWCATQVIIQEIRIWDKEAVLHKRQQELADAKVTSKQLTSDVKRYRNFDYLMELAHRHGYGKPGEKNYQVGNE
jgi:cell division protein DivIC